MNFLQSENMHNSLNPFKLHHVPRNLPANHAHHAPDARRSSRNVDLPADSIFDNDDGDLEMQPIRNPAQALPIRQDALRENQINRDQPVAMHAENAHLQQVSLLSRQGAAGTQKDRENLIDREDLENAPHLRLGHRVNGNDGEFDSFVLMVQPVGREETGDYQVNIHPMPHQPPDPAPRQNPISIPPLNQLLMGSLVGAAGMGTGIYLVRDGMITRDEGEVWAGALINLIGTVFAGVSCGLAAYRIHHARRARE